MAYVYTGDTTDFYAEYGGLPQRPITLTNLFLLFIIIIVVIVIVTLLALLLRRTTPTYVDRNDLVNLDVLKDLNVPTTRCCVLAGPSAPTTEEYVYDTLTNTTYSRLRPNPGAGGSQTPTAAFRNQPYYTFQSGLFIGCANTAQCPLA
jgi:hypothetical protein